MGKLGATLTLVLTRARRGCVIHRCQNKNPREVLGPGDEDDVVHRKRGLKFEKKQWVEFLPPNERVEISDLAEARRICALRTPRVGWVESWRCKSRQHRKIVCLSLSSCRITFNSKVIKSFVAELRSRKVFRVFGFPMSISHIRLSGYVTYCASQVFWT